jgi:UDP-N-acetylmuramoyl-tripeptide--D-alanyl-D-alanine ligase
MESTFLRDIAKAVGGRLCEERFGGITVREVETDSRYKTDQGLFIPLKGERFDGHDFIGQAFANGAVAALSEREPDAEKPVITVENTYKALLDLAAWHRGRFGIPIVGVTGSAGKTTTKDMIASVLAQKFNVCKTEANHNNEVGLPFSVLKLNGSHTAAVFEMGMNRAGEIRLLAGVSRPTVSVITNIGSAHIENLGSKEGIFKAKCEILEFNPEKIVINGDDEFLKVLSAAEGAERRGNVVSFGMEDYNDVYATDEGKMGLDGVRFTVNTRSGAFPVRIKHPIGGAVPNALAAAAVGTVLGLTHSEIAAGLLDFEPSEGRMVIVRTPKSVILDDSYNANAEAMKATINFLAGLDEYPDKVLIMGDMLELGGFSAQLHADCGLYAAEKGLKRLIFIGGHAKSAYEAVKGMHGGAEWFADKEAFIAAAVPIINAAVLVKASNSVKLGDVIPYI